MPLPTERRRLLAGLSGRVVEIGAGRGPNFALYPAAVTDVVAVEPDAGHRAQARWTARSARVPIRVVDGVAESLPLPAGGADVAVASLVLCSVADVAAALEEVRRVLRPGGELRFLEHVIAPRGALRVFQRVAAPVWRNISDGCDIARDAEAAIAAAGFALEDVERFAYRDGPLEPALPHVLGRARAPGRARRPGRERTAAPTGSSTR